MHFRVRPKGIQVIRTTYDADAKGAKSEVLGRIDRTTLQPTDELRAACTDQELEEVSAWIAHYKRAEALRLELAARTLGAQIEQAVDWFRVTDSAEARIVAAEILPQLNRLRSTLKNQNLLG